VSRNYYWFVTRDGLEKEKEVFRNCSTRMFMDWEEKYRENDEKPEVEYQIFVDMVRTLYA
jgi:hypothetical protein